MMGSDDDIPVRRRIQVRGLVQGIGYRPYVHAMARRFGLSGRVWNDSTGVFIEIQGRAGSILDFQGALLTEPPPLAVIQVVSYQELAICEESEFTIVESHDRRGGSTPVSPDLATCVDCLRELFDPSDRRFRYPFLNCTQCGPRYTILRELPYDRPNTTMAGFAMCADCLVEYDDPLNRRFHAQPNACPACGPKVWLVPSERASEALDLPDSAAGWVQGEDGIRAAKEALSAGKIVAVKGLGGFHLACDASSDAAVTRLRERKGRAGKPFAVMFADMLSLRCHADVSGEEERILSGKERPIVLLSKVPRSKLPESVAPANAYVGVMLPYTPLHHLLLEDGPLVMTSGNRSEEPIARDNSEAFSRLSFIADYFLVHDRPIHVVCDDSVVRVFENQEAPIRRSRGYAPFPVVWPIPGDGPTVLAVGGELKATFCLVKPPYAYVGPHIGDMGNLETLQAFERAADHFEGLFRAKSDVLVHDMHPGYASTAWAEARSAATGAPTLAVQHHHAHAASIMAENGLDGSSPVIAVIFDGTGYGTDGAIWGGEFLIADYRDFKRVAHLSYISLPGGDAAVKRPYRVALAHLWAAGIAWDEDLPCVAACPFEERKILLRQFETGLNCVPTSSMGRLFDAVASLIGVRHEVSYEAQAAIEMESICSPSHEFVTGDFQIDIAGDTITIDPVPVLRRLIEGLRRGESRQVLAMRFHRFVSTLIVRVCNIVRSRTSLDVVVLSGGVFQNLRLLDLSVEHLREQGFRVLTHRIVPPNDGGLALGQAAIGWVKHRDATRV